MNPNAKFTLQHLGALAVARDACHRSRPDEHYPHLAIRPRDDLVPAALGRADGGTVGQGPAVRGRLYVGRVRALRSTRHALEATLPKLNPPVPACRPHQRARGRISCRLGVSRPSSVEDPGSFQYVCQLAPTTIFPTRTSRTACCSAAGFALETGYYLCIPRLACSAHFRKQFPATLTAQPRSAVPAAKSGRCGSVVVGQGRVDEEVTGAGVGKNLGVESDPVSGRLPSHALIGRREWIGVSHMHLRR